MRISDILLRLIGARDPNCPNEADVLAYSENRLSTRSRAQVERHFADCHDCRQVLAFLGRESEEAAAQLTEEAVSAQTDRVLAYIQNDERNRSKPAQKARAAAGFYISYPRLASVGLVICAIAVAGVFMFTGGQSPADAAMDALRLAGKDARYTEARVSGGFDHSRYAGTTRGDDSNHDDLLLSRAENKVKAAAQEPAAVEARLVLARVYLARGTREDAKRALEILDQLARSGVETAEALNDMGVAQFQLNKYQEAIDDFGKALAKSPGYDEALFNRALAEQRDHRDDEATQDWQRFINQSSDENWKNEARNYLNRLSGPTDR
jgi:tetratricopeptide (TPR) repeat protein